MAERNKMYLFLSYDGGKSALYFSFFISSGLFYEIQNNDIRMEMAFHEAFKQLQARTLQTKLKSTVTIENMEEGVKVEPSFGPWGVVQESTTAIKTEGLSGGRGLRDRTGYKVDTNKCFFSKY